MKTRLVSGILPLALLLGWGCGGETQPPLPPGFFGPTTEDIGGDIPDVITTPDVPLAPEDIGTEDLAPDSALPPLTDVIDDTQEIGDGE